MPATSPRPDRYALVGHPVAHSRSPLIHQLFARQTGQNLTYELIDALPEEFETAARGFGAAGGRGLNVTLPHKEAAYELCVTHGPEADLAGAVNTITFRGRQMHGDNTDGIGFIRDLNVNHQCAITGRRLLLLGAGGAARGIVGPILAERPQLLLIANRTLERAEKLCRDFGTPANVDVSSFDELGEVPPNLPPQSGVGRVAQLLPQLGHGGIDVAVVELDAFYGVLLAATPVAIFEPLGRAAGNGAKVGVVIGERLCDGLRAVFGTIHERSGSVVQRLGHWERFSGPP